MEKDSARNEGKNRAADPAKSAFGQQQAAKRPGEKVTQSQNAATAGRQPSGFMAKNSPKQ